MNTSPPKSAFFRRRAGFFKSLYTILPRREAVNLDGADSFTVLDIELPPGLARGAYQGCGVLIPAGDDPWDGANWQAVHCAGFELEK